MVFQEIVEYENNTIINNLKDIFGYINKNKYDFGLIFSLDGVFLGKVDSLKDKLNEDKFIEARFFNDKKELFVFYDGEQYKAVQTNKDEWKKEKICRPYILDAKFQENDNINYIQVIEFIDYDDDGQAFVKASCLDGVK